MSYVPQITNRSIGQVEIIDLKGDFVGPWAMKGRDEIQHFVEREKPKNLLINLKNVDSIDSLGVKAIVDNLDGDFKGGIVSGSYSVTEMFSRVEPPVRVQFFKDEEAVIEHFAEDLAKEGKGIPSVQEKRNYPRLRTALPLHFSYTKEDTQEQVVFHAIITNLSEGGLYAEYLDMNPGAENILQLNPYDFKMMDLEIKFPNEQSIHVYGKVLRTDKEGEQLGIGIEFYQISKENQALIQEFIKE